MRFVNFLTRLRHRCTVALGLRYCGTVYAPGRTSQVYSNIPVQSRTPTSITFEDGWSVARDGAITSGDHHGRVVTIWENTQNGVHFFATRCD